MTLNLKIGEILLADLNPNFGTEPGKTRPVFIIQNQTLLDVSHPSTLIIPLTTNLIDDAAPLRIRINRQDQLEKDSDLLMDQIRAIDNKRITIGPLTKCDETLIEKIYNALFEILGK
jgi:mRNA interferase MazF